MTARSEPRFTRDVDLCVVANDDQDAERLVFDLRDLGYRLVATVEHKELGRLAAARLRNADGIICDLLIASSGVEHEVVARATEVELAPETTLPVATVEDLLALKTLSATARRPQDAADIRALIDFNPRFDRDSVLETLQLIELRGYHRGQDLSQKFADLTAQSL